jgi:hypothetical protein
MSNTNWEKGVPKISNIIMFVLINLQNSVNMNIVLDPGSYTCMYWRRCDSSVTTRIKTAKTTKIEFLLLTTFLYKRKVL